MAFSVHSLIHAEACILQMALTSPDIDTFRSKGRPDGAKRCFLDSMSKRRCLGSARLATGLPQTIIWSPAGLVSPSALAHGPILWSTTSKPMKSGGEFPPHLRKSCQKSCSAWRTDMWRMGSHAAPVIICLFNLALASWSAWRVAPPGLTVELLNCHPMHPQALVGIPSLLYVGIQYLMTTVRDGISVRAHQGGRDMASTHLLIPIFHVPYSLPPQ